MKAVVTGGAGFIGSHLTEALVDLGYDVHVLDWKQAKMTECVKNDRVVYHELDICSKEARELVVSIDPSYLFHLAAQADVGISIDNPMYDAQINISGTINMLDACRETRSCKMIFASTAAVYGLLDQSEICEEDPVNPESNYGLSKLTAESYIRIYHKLYGIPYTILRYANVYGPRQLPKGDGGVVAVFMKNILSSGAVSVHGDGDQTRDFIFVKDVAAANIAAMKDGNNETIQISTGETYSINELIGYIKKSHRDEFVTQFSSARKGDIKHSCLANHKARSLLKWNPVYRLETGLKETYVYYRSL
ncbi:NAD-dependent epimerase/dehydratase family protein [Bacillus sp. FJAT-42376]|uniref:GDP-mannose 4,6-dehydratase n=1 Tax=Bacillus sp. FJAT-42376 TaxID=2014076 RepID=UPI000F4D96F6|nr:GDP-mannose 4,6-dehydratase [Bacillus sp. FJAT-42376]AZB43226.1 NAD-dependent epimerase/dehydratase family protein [Bacillus sp. FJAT-42376]